MFTDENGFAEFSENFAITDHFISATATDFYNNTSEFSMVDTDADALGDAWEDASIAGFIDINEDGTADLTLAGSVNSLGWDVKPDRKDLFVEVDAMGSITAGGQYPDPTALPSVEAAFAQAPAVLVNNPPDSQGNPQPGIALHAIVDETDIPVMPFPNTDSGTSWPELEWIKLVRLGTAAERSNPNWFIAGRAAKELVYRYCMFGLSYDATGSSGLSELARRPLADGEYQALGGSDFIVTLGTWIRAAGPDGRRGTADDILGGGDFSQERTFMHELGHTLGLFHGGDQSELTGGFNYKPNYESIMSYLWQIPKGWMLEDSNQNGLQDFWDINGNGVKDPFETYVEFDRNGNGWNAGDLTWFLNYSDSNFGNLDETNLSEPAGINGHPGHWVSAGPLVNGNPQIVSETGPVDWNRDGDTICSWSLKASSLSGSCARTAAMISSDRAYFSCW